MLQYIRLTSNRYSFRIQRSRFRSLYHNYIDMVILALAIEYLLNRRITTTMHLVQKNTLDSDSKLFVFLSEKAMNLVLWFNTGSRRTTPKFFKRLSD